MEGKALRNAACAALLASCLVAPSAAFADASGSTDVTVVAPWGNPGQVTYVVSETPAKAYPRTGDAPAAMLAALLAAAASAAGIVTLASREE